jgi:Skp family chaperone for outer membrane proteins
MQKDLDELKTSIAKDQDDFKHLRLQVDDPMITADEKRTREMKAQDAANLIQTDEASAREMANQGEQKLERDYQNLTDLVLQDIQTAVKAKAKAAGFSLVLNISADTLQANSPVIYSNGDNDITDEIVKQLNAAEPDASLKAATNATATNAVPSRR